MARSRSITSFSFEESTGSANAQPRYMVLFFDNSTMDMGDQAKARDAAAKFIDANAGPDRLIAIADFGGTVRITQNFTADAQRLKQVVTGMKGSAVSPNAAASGDGGVAGSPPAAPSLGNAEADFGIHTVLLALRSLAKGMSDRARTQDAGHVDLRLSAESEYQSELTAVIDTCNKVERCHLSHRCSRLGGSGHASAARPTGAAFDPFRIRHHVPAAFHYSEYPTQPLRLAAFAEPAAFLVATAGGGGGGWRR